MNHVNYYAKDPTRRIAWQVPRNPAHSDHQQEVINHEAGAALKRNRG